MYKSFIHPIYIIINDLFNNGLHRLEIIDFGPPFCQIDADLVDGVLHRTILRTVRWTKNDTMSTLAHGLVNLRRTVRREVVVDESPAKSRILIHVVSFEHMLDENTVSLCLCPGLSGNPCPNTRITYRADIPIGNIWIARLNCQDDGQFECSAIIVPRFANFQTNGSRAVPPVRCVEVQTELVRIDQLTARNPVNPNWPRLRPKKASVVQISLGKCLVCKC